MKNSLLALLVCSCMASSVAFADAAARTSCQNNLKQLGMAATQQGTETKMLETTCEGSASKPASTQQQEPTTGLKQARTSSSASSAGE